MILADTSVWIDHLRASNTALSALLANGRVITHPFVIGEICLGSLRQRQTIVDELNSLRRAASATDEEVMSLVERHALAGTGIGWIDAHLIASTLLTPDTQLLTYDKKLAAVATRLSLAASVTH